MNNKCYYCKKQITHKEIFKNEATYYLDIYKPIHKICLETLEKKLKRRKRI